jgi:DNA-binding winged helix-turn-helix (wHTH) protein/tetratricopeptide (TPR) repeat protein
MGQAATCAYAFGPFMLVPAERLLLRNGNPVRLTPKAFALLVLLVEHTGRVLGKDQLLEALWPGRFVIEANLTKHIWMLRRALGGDDERYIETVPKLGYRFAATVETIASARNGAGQGQVPVAGPTDETSAGALSRIRLRRPAWLAASLAAGVAGIILIVLFSLYRSPSSGDSPSPGATVALTDPTDLSPVRDTNWIGPAVQEMLGASLSLGSRLRAVPRELVSEATLGLPVPQAGGYGPSSLVALKRRLGTDYVVSGSYFVAADQTVRLDFVIQDARNQGNLGTVTESGKLANLPALTTRIGDDLYRALVGKGVGRIEVADAGALAPPTSEAMRHMGLGLEALRASNAAHARDEFLSVVVNAPDYALAYADLSRAWLDLGYRDKALAAAEQASVKSNGLPQPVRLQIELERSEAAFDWTAAIASLRSLVVLDPGNPEYRLRLVDVLTQAGKLNDAQLALTKLRNLGAQTWTDARVEIAAARLANAHEDTAACVAHATRALELARAHEAPGQAAAAEAILGSAKTATNPHVAAAYLMQALADYRAVGSPRGEAEAYRDLGILFSDSDPAKGRDFYTKSLALSQSIGDENGIAAAEADIGTVLWFEGDRDGAEAAVRRVLEIRKEINDPRGQAWAFTALGVEQTDAAASDNAINNFRRAIALDRAAGASSHLAFTLFQLSDVLRLRGKLAEAADVCAQAQAINATLADPSLRGQADFECALIALDRGNLHETETELVRAGDWAAQHSDTMTVADAELTLGQIAMARRDWRTAANRFNRADQLSTRADIVTGQALSASLLALCDQATGRASQAASDARRAKTLRARMNEREEAMIADIALAQYLGRTGERGQALATLNALSADAERRQWLSWAFEAKLAAIEFIPPSAAARARSSLKTQARQAGFLWVAKRLS